QARNSSRWPYTSGGRPGWRLLFFWAASYSEEVKTLLPPTLEDVVTAGTSERPFPLLMYWPAPPTHTRGCRLLASRRRYQIEGPSSKRLEFRHTPLFFCIIAFTSQPSHGRATCLSLSDGGK